MESCFGEKDGGRVWKDYVERIKNAEDNWEHNVEGDAVEGPLDFLSRDKVDKN